MKKFEILEHTADVALRIYGKNLNELFVNAASGLMSFIIDEKEVTAKEKVVIKLREDNVEELLVSWLNELIFNFSAKYFLSKKFKILHIDDLGLEAEVSGEKFDAGKHKIISEIKAATYHELEVAKIKKGWQAKVILDT